VRVAFSPNACVGESGGERIPLLLKAENPKARNVAAWLHIAFVDQ